MKMKWLLTSSALFIMGCGNNFKLNDIPLKPGTIFKGTSTEPAPQAPAEASTGAPAGAAPSAQTSSTAASNTPATEVTFPPVTAPGTATSPAVVIPPAAAPTVTTGTASPGNVTGNATGTVNGNLAGSETSADQSTSVLSLTEYLNLLQLINVMSESKYTLRIHDRIFPTGADQKDFRVNIKGGTDNVGLSYQVLNKETVVSSIENKKINLQGFNSSIAENGFEFAGSCLGLQCEILFITLSKFDGTGKLVENYPMTLKKVQGKYAVATFKDPKAYAAEKNALGSNYQLKLAPQLAVKKQLATFLNNQKRLLVAEVNAILKSDESISYSNQVLGRAHFKPESLRPQFSRENANLFVAVEIQQTGPQIPLILKSEFKDPSSSEKSSVYGDLSLVAFAKDQQKNFVLSFNQKVPTSAISNVTSSLQLMVCSLLEESSIFLSECQLLKASDLTGEQDVVEFSAQEKVKSD